MTLLQLLLMLAVGAVIVYGVILLLDKKWRELFIMIVVVFVIIWILGALGLDLPKVPSLK